MVKKINLRLIRYILFFVGLIILWYTGQIFVQNFNMQKTIQTLKQKQVELKWNTYWLKNYYEPFLKTEYAKTFFSHKNGVPLENEIVVNIVSYQWGQSTWTTQEVVDFKVQKNNLNWQKFFDKILKTIWVNIYF